ncbi:MAG: TIGR03560 family F420-dependent LLM class oxidoreductase [Gammaproteobacteria bacterium]|nr:TIGR03560 family F420-dependent LLM class oxidoreductase [Gammaproteobacteria bacterium]MXY55404.1 TIGR03560 family F420-dependent LLM class oxidoreductase [Gammaproteobacteria bacterium]MYF31609.1 TIGR03560 family F420-dependent LLM class oxidoreductase [Gammaproteobacteria bacterium]
MIFGLQMSQYNTRWSDVAAVAKTVEAGRWHSLWLSDHFMPPGRGGHGWAMEGWTLLTAVAMVTERVRLGILATGNTYRNPALLAKIATTLDHISGGRVELGLGAAWYEQEHTAYGWDFPSLRERSDRLEEATQLIRLLLTKDPEEYVNYAGKHYQLNDAPMSPRTAQDKPIPILIGGNGEKRTLRTCARYGDTSNLDFWHPGGVDVYKQKQQAIDRHCENFGRDPAEVRRTVCLPTRVFDSDEEWKKSPGQPWYCYGTVNAIQDYLGGYIEAGADEIMLCGFGNSTAAIQRVESEVLSVF